MELYLALLEGGEIKDADRRLVAPVCHGEHAAVGAHAHGCDNTHVVPKGHKLLMLGVQAVNATQRVCECDGGARTCR